MRIRWIPTVLVLLLTCSLLGTLPLGTRPPATLPVQASASGHLTVRDVNTGNLPASSPIPTIVIDPGHGGMDGGAVGENGLLEKDLNLTVSLKLADFLRQLGFPVVLSRERDEMQGSKVEDIHARYDLAASLGDNVVFVSIHQNKFPQTSSHGTQVFYGQKAAESKTLAKHLQSRVVTLLQPENKRQIQPGTDSVYLLKNLPCTAVMVECGFLSNPGDVSLLTDPAYQSKLAFVLAGSIAEYCAGKAGTPTDQNQ